jgi:cell division protein FtsQ
MLAMLWHNPRLMRLLSAALLALALLILATSGLKWATHRALFSIQLIQVAPLDAGEKNAGFRHVNVATARAAALPRILNATHMNFFTVNLEAIRLAFENVAWVRHAQVSRVWPNRLLVEIEEHQVLGAWQDNTDRLATDPLNADGTAGSNAPYSFVNTHGELFAVNPAEAEDDAEDGLPGFSGPSGSEKVVVSKYQELEQTLAPLKLKLDQVSLSSRYAWSLHGYRPDAEEIANGNNSANNGGNNSGNNNAPGSASDGGLDIELGREIEPNILAKRINRLLVTYPLITAQWPKPTLIDLRYSNGFALRAENLKLESENGTKAAPVKPASKAVIKVSPNKHA